MKNNVSENSFWFCRLGIFAALILPVISFQPFFYPPSWTKATALKIIVAFLFAILLYQILFNYKKLSLPDVKNNPIFWAFGLFFAVFLITSIFSVDPYFSFWGDPERGGGFINLIFYGLFGLLALLLLQKEKWKKMWTFSLGAAAAISVLSVLSFYEFFPGILLAFNPRLGSSIGNAIPLGTYLVMLLFVAAALFFSEGDGKRRIFYALSALLLLFNLFLTGSRGAYLGFLAAAFYFLIFYPNAGNISHSAVKNEAGRPKDYRDKISSVMASKWLKIAALFLLAVSVSTALYATYGKIPETLSENRIAKLILPRLSLKTLAQEERFKTWETVIRAIKEKPAIGWGMENLAVGFDKHFDPVKTPLGWWDRSHNIFLDATAEAGIPGLLAYIGLFAALFWHLHRVKTQICANEKTDLHRLENKDARMMAHGLAASLAGYVAAGIFGINSFETLFIFFLIAVFTAHISDKISSFAPENVGDNANQRSRGNIINKLSLLPAAKKKAIFSGFAVLTFIFIWQYNAKPFSVNSSLNLAKIMAENGLCDQALEKLEKINLPRKILGQYSALEAAQAIKSCAEQYPEKIIPYSEKSLAVLERSALLHPLSGKLLVLAGDVASTIAAPELDPEVKEEYLAKSYQYYQKALALSEKNHGILLKMAQVDLLGKDCLAMREKSEQCADLNPADGSCHWSRALSFICEGNFQAAEENVQMAKNLDFEPRDDSSVKQIINAYIAVENYEKAAEFYEFLVQKYDYNLQYHASLAEAYRLSGQYEKAREAALRIIEVSKGQYRGKEHREQIKKEVEAFLQLLPPPPPK